MTITPDVIEDLAADLERRGLTVSVNGPWAVHGQPKRTGGWKLHLSSTPVCAGRVLDAAVPVLAEARVPFKVAKSIEILILLNEGELGETQVGKFLTVYPTSDEQAVDLADKLVAATAGLDGPSVPSDAHLGSVVYARVGTFKPIVRRDVLGQPSLWLHAPNGTLVQDSYSVPFVLDSRWTWPFRMHPPHRRDETPAARLHGPGYLLLEVAKAHPKGCVFTALDCRNQEEVRPVIVKQGRRHCLSDRLGRDMRDRLAAQRDWWPTLAGLGVRTPAVLDYYETDDGAYLVTEYVPGATIEATAAKSHAANTDLGQLHHLYVCLVDQVRQLHDAGIIHRDLSASNIWIDQLGFPQLLDFELAWDLSDPHGPFTGGTPGFMSPQQQQREPPAASDDVYSLGALAFLLLTGIDPRRVTGEHANPGLALRTITRAELTGEFLDAVESSLAPNREERPRLQELQQALGAATWHRRVAYPKAPSVTKTANLCDRLMKGLLEAPTSPGSTLGLGRARKRRESGR
ncbi:protein kinase domain-containing protein [Kribbella ginsengisoli]|uniref:Protein kinase domain-containing protein n=1 Tax=Kribbella ginsengisoli TaxID=363865 RepID=A0ABP6VNH2_9ACTN